MPLPKILAPYLPASEQYNDGKEYVLSPNFPFSPPQHNNTVNSNGDPIIEIYTLDESASAKSNKTIMGERDTPCMEESESSDINDTNEPSEQNKVVLYHQPMSEHIDRETPSMAMYQPAHATAGIDFSPPARFFEEDTIALDQSMPLERTMLLGRAVTLAHTRPLERAISLERTTPLERAISLERPMSLKNTMSLEHTMPLERTIPLVHPMPLGYTMSLEQPIPLEQPKKMRHIPSEHIQPCPPEPVEKNYNNPPVENTHFAMEPTSQKSESDFKSKCLKMIRNAKGLVCKPDNPKTSPNRVNSPARPIVSHPIMHPPVPPLSVPPPSVPLPMMNRPTLKPIDTSFVPATVKKEETCSTPIYLRHNTSLKSSNKEAPYKSPVKGTVAYDIKLLCDQSFFGRW